MTRFAVSRPITTVVMFAVFLTLGLMGLLRLPVEMFPKVSLPTASVIYFYRGAGPEEVEQQVIKPVEEAFASVANVKTIRSIAQENIGVVTVTFNYKANIDVGVNDLRAALDEIRRLLPRDLDPPTIFKFDISQFPVLAVTISAKDSATDVRSLFFEEIIDRFNQVDGVGQVQFWGGGRKRQFQVNVDLLRLDRAGLTLQDLVRAIAADNLTLPAGNITVDRTDYTVRIPGDITRPEEVAWIPLMGGLTVGDVARVEEAYADPKSYVRVDYQDAIFFAILKQHDANTVDVAYRVKALLKELEREYPNLQFTVINDFSRFVEQSVNNLRTNVLLGGLLVLLVTFLFLGNLRGSIITALVIPTSLIGGFLLLWMTGSSINLISLSAMAIAVGMVVDNAVVVLENIFYHRERGESRAEAALFGTQEVAEAILASTLTTVAIFLPIITARGFIGVFFRELAYIVSFTLFVSLIAAYMLTPALSRLFLRVHRAERKPAYARWIDGVWARLEATHRATLSLALRHKAWTWVLALALFGGGMVLFSTGAVKTEFMPVNDTGEFRALVELPPGTPLDVTDSVMREVERYLDTIPEVMHVAIRTGPTESGFGTIMGMTEAPSAGMAFIRLVPVTERTRSQSEIAHQVDRWLRSLPGLRTSGVVLGNVGNQLIFGAGSDVEIEIYGNDLDATDSLARWLKTRLLDIPGVVNPRVSRERGRPEFRLELDRQKLRALHLPMALVAAEMRTALFGSVPTRIRRGGEEYDVLVRLDPKYRDRESILETYRIRTPLGTRVPLASLGTVHISSSPLNIERKNRERVVRVSADVMGRSLGEVSQDVERLLQGLSLPSGVHVVFGGAVKEQRESFQQMFIAMIFGILLVYLVMVALFQSFLMPFVIMFSVPFAFVGVALILALTGVPLSVNAYLGMVMLVGIVVNNAIVLLDYIELLQLRGRAFLQSVVDGAVRRMRPVLITTLTTVFGLVPMAVLKGEGSETWRPLGLAVIGGLLFASLVTLVFVPVVYVSFENLKRRITRKGGTA